MLGLQPFYVAGMHLMRLSSYGKGKDRRFAVLVFRDPRGGVPVKYSGPRRSQ